MKLRPITDDERAAFTRAVGRQFGERLPPDRVQRYARVIETDRSVAAFEGDRIVATTAVETYQMAVPGGIAGCAGITAVGVRTDFRRRGLLTRMMRQAIDQAAERGESLSALYASEQAIYGRYGYGPAAPTVRLRLEATHPLLSDPVDDEVRLVDDEEARQRMRAVYDAVWARWPGMLARTESRWELLHGQDDAGGEDGTASHYHACVSDRGYAVYRLISGSGDGPSNGTVRVVELLAADSRAQAALWQFLASVDLYPNVDARLRPPDEPLGLMLRDPDRLRTSGDEALWLRLVDVPAALAARRYSAVGELVIEVADEFCPQNAGRWALRGGSEEASCERTDRSPDLSLDAAALASVYLGGHRWSTLLRARRVTEHAAGAARRADAMFASDPLPWNVRIF